MSFYSKRDRSAAVGETSGVHQIAERGQQNSNSRESVCIGDWILSQINNYLSFSEGL